LLNGEHVSLGWWTAGMQRRLYAWRSVVLSRSASRIRDRLGGIQGCNQSFWRKHALQVNGYDERFNAWGTRGIDDVSSDPSEGAQLN
jgi:hypothetical protein